MKKKLFIYLDEPERSVYIAEIITMCAMAGLLVIYLVLNRTIPSFADIMACKFKKITGIPCPSCGGTRALIYLVRGDLLTSIYYHATVIYIVILSAFFFVTQTLKQLTKGRTRSMRWHNWYWIAGVVIYIVQYILKLAIPGYIL